jgi:hypothetical protein
MRTVAEMKHDLERLKSKLGTDITDITEQQ